MGGHVPQVCGRVEVGGGGAKARVEVDCTDHTLHSHLCTLPSPPSISPVLGSHPTSPHFPLPHHFHMSELCCQVQGGLFLVVPHVCVSLLLQQVLHHLLREDRTSERMFVCMYVRVEWAVPEDYTVEPLFKGHH